jgi:hypothetical protein
MIIDTWKSPYKIRTDGKTDNAAGLMKLRTALAAADEHHMINFKSGLMLSSYNKWLVGVRSFEVIGCNTVFKSLYTGSDEAFHRPVFAGELFQNNVLDYNGTKLYQQADRFIQALPGASLIALITSHGDYAAGDRVLLYSGNYAPDGYPPPAAAEWRVVTHVEGNLLSLNMPLTKKYLESQWDNPIISAGGCGKPRVINLDRKENRYGDYARFEGITFANSISGADGNFTFPAMRLELRRCRIEGFFWPSEARTVVIEDTDINKTEFDKIVESVECNNVRFACSPNGGGSIGRIFLNNCEAASGIRFDPRHLEIRNTQVRMAPDPSVNVDVWGTSLDTYPAKNPIRTAVIENLTFSSVPNAESDFHISKFPYCDMAIVEISEDEGIPCNDFDIIKTMEAGTTTLFNRDGSNGGLVTDISHNGKTFIIKGTWRPPQVGEVWMWSYVKNVIDLGGHQILDGKMLYNWNSIRWKGNTSVFPVKEMHLNQDDFIWRKGQNSNIQISLFGYYLSAEFYLSRGAAGMKMNIQAGSDTLFETNFAGREWCRSPRWVEEAYLNTYDIVGNVTPDLLPRFNLIIKWREF